MIDLVFHSDTNQQLAQQELESLRIKVEPGPYGTLRIHRADLVARLAEVEEVVTGFSGHMEGE